MRTMPAQLWCFVLCAGEILIVVTFRLRVRRNYNQIRMKDEWDYTI